MHYFKNVDLTKMYPVSEKAVRNWIDSARKGKLDLALYESDGKQYIANTTKNQLAINELVKKRKKYINTRGHRVVRPKSEFYKLYSDEHVFDIISNLEIHHEIPRQYNYFDGGAEYWDKYSERLFHEETPNMVNSTVKLLETNTSYIDNLLNGYKRVNVIDIGVGNCLPAKNTLARLLDKGVMGRYIAIDISSEMLQIAERNIKKWFGDQIEFEGYVRDINYDRFADILVKERLRKDAKDSVNLVLFLGGTLGNMRSQDEALKTIHNSMGRSDLLMFTTKLDSKKTRRYFDFNTGTTDQPLAPQYKFIIDLLSVSESFYEVELGFNEKEQSRYLQIRLKVALTIEFEFEEGTRQIEFNKGESILLWRFWHQSSQDVVNQFDTNGFDVLQASKTVDHDYLLAISEVHTSVYGIEKD